MWLRAADASCTAGATPWAEKTIVAPGGRLFLRVDEDGAACLQIAHDVDVVHDLLPHVHGRPVVLERELDRLDGALHPGAVAAR